MMVSFCKQLIAVVLLATVLFAPLNSIAQDLNSGAMKEVCTYQMLQDNGSHDGNGQSDDCPCDGSGDCGDHEECCHDTMEHARASGVNIYLYPIQIFYLEPAKTFPKVYLAIFVPPES